MNPTSRSVRLWVLMLGAIVGAEALGAQPAGDFDDQLRAGLSALQAGREDTALSAAGAAINAAPDRWEGYALSGRALLALKRFESATDAFSQAIELAPAAQQPQLRALRRQTVLQESGIAPGAPPPAAAITSPELAAPAAALPRPPEVAAERPRTAPFVLLSGTSSDATWTDAAGLTWARPWYYPAPDSGPVNYSQASAVCAGLRLLGAQDWRVPTVDEVKRVYLPSSRAFRYSWPKFDPNYGLEEAIRRDAWRVRNFTVGGDTFVANRLLIWSSTPGEAPGEHEAVYFGLAYSVPDGKAVGSSFRDRGRRMPFHAYVLCVRPAVGTR